MEKQNYLVKTYTIFYNGHGEGEYGGSDLSLSDNGEYGELKEGQEYDDELEEVDDDESGQAEDGYNCEREYITIRKITPEEATEFTKTIGDYNVLTSTL